MILLYALFDHKYGTPFYGLQSCQVTILKSDNTISGEMAILK